MRGNSHDEQLREHIAYLHGRLELEIEYYCHHQGLDPMATTTLVGAALVGTPMDNLPALLQKAGAARSTAPEMEMVDRAYGRRAQVATKRGTGKAAKNQMTRSEKSRAANRSYWDKMTPEQRKREMKKRFAKWNPKAKKKWRGGKTKTPKAKLALQKIYQARHNAKKNGETPPPLPKAA